MMLSRNSVRLRLYVASLGSIALALVIAGVGLTQLFQSHVERRSRAEMNNHIRQLASSLTFRADGTPALSRSPADPRFDQQLSGLYWQIEEEGGRVLLRSRSLWDTALALPLDKLPPGQVHSHEIKGPLMADLLVHEEPVIFRAPAGERILRLEVAMDRADVRLAVHVFVEQLTPSLALLALVLVGSAWLQINIGLRPLEAVRQGVNAITSRQKRRLDDVYPEEVKPLVNEVNELLDARDKAVERARTRAGDLAHGLKTPLTVLIADARKLHDMGQREMAREIAEMARTMQRHIEHELARTRVAVEARRAPDEADVARIVRGIVGALRKTPWGEQLEWRLDLPPRLDAWVDPDDFMEVAGNLLENASKWAKSRVFVSARNGDGAVRLTIADDGPGVPSDMLAELGQRGARLDAQTTGTGIGLAIVKEIIEAYGGRLLLRNGVNGGLVAEAEFPMAA
jgi:signal transduction histidine kinase